MGETEFMRGHSPGTMEGRGSHDLSNYIKQPVNTLHKFCTILLIPCSFEHSPKMVGVFDEYMVLTFLCVLMLYLFCKIKLYHVEGLVVGGGFGGLKLMTFLYYSPRFSCYINV